MKFIGVIVSPYIFAKSRHDNLYYNVSTCVFLSTADIQEKIMADEEEQAEETKEEKPSE